MPWFGNIYGGGYNPNDRTYPGYKPGMPLGEPRRGLSGTDSSSWMPSNWSYVPDAVERKLSIGPNGTVSNYSVPGSPMWEAGINRPPASILQTNPDGSYALTDGSTFAQSKPPTAATLPFPHPGVGVVGGQNNNFMAMLMEWFKRLGGIQNSWNKIPYRGW